MTYSDIDAVHSVIYDFELSQNAKILNRNGKDWYELCDSFTGDELAQMKDFLLEHPISCDYDWDDINTMLYDYIMWWSFDLINCGEPDDAKRVLNAGYV